MQRHSEIGEGILANVDTYAEIASSFDIITSESTARAIRTACRRSRFRSCPGSSRSQTRTTR